MKLCNSKLLTLYLFEFSEESKKHFYTTNRVFIKAIKLTTTVIHLSKQFLMFRRLESETNLPNKGNSKALLWFQFFPFEWVSISP